MFCKTNPSDSSEQDTRSGDSENYRQMKEDDGTCFAAFLFVHRHRLLVYTCSKFRLYNWSAHRTAIFKIFLFLCLYFDSCFCIFNFSFFEYDNLHVLHRILSVSSEILSVLVRPKMKDLFLMKHRNGKKKVWGHGGVVARVLHPGTRRT
jgi:hypothetical protein